MAPKRNPDPGENPGKKGNDDANPWGGIFFRSFIAQSDFNYFRDSVACVRVDAVFVTASSAVLSAI